MKGVTPALRYARALIEVARESGAIPDIEKDLGMVEKIIKDIPEIRRFCGLSRQPLDSRIECVQAAFGDYVSDLTRRTLRVIAENDRLGVIPLLGPAVERLRREEGGVTQIVLESAAPPENRLETAIKKKMAARLGCDVDLISRVNPGLLGGFRVFWDDRLLDNSARARIHALRRQFTQAVMRHSPSRAVN